MKRVDFEPVLYLALVSMLLLLNIFLPTERIRGVSEVVLVSLMLNLSKYLPTVNMFFCHNTEG